MSKSASLRDRDVVDRAHPKRSIKSATIATWRTDHTLKIIGVSRNPQSPIKALPRVGQVLSGKGRMGVLRRDAHVSALQGVPTSYEFRLLNESFHVDVAPRYSAHRKIIGVRASLRLVADNVPNEADAQHAELMKRLAHRRKRNAWKSAVQSLELARAVADTAKTNAELRNLRAMQQQQMAVEAQIKAEAEERRSRLLADTSVLLDASFDFEETIQEVAKLLVMRIAEWCVIHQREDKKLRRIAVCHRQEAGLELLQSAFPEEEEEEEENSIYTRTLRLGDAQLFAVVTPADMSRLASSSAGAAELRKLGPQSVMQAPVKSHGRTIGLLTVGSTDPGRIYEVLDLQMIQSLAHRIGLARESAVLYADAQREIAMRKEVEARLQAFNSDLERRVRERTGLLEEATREANSFAYTVAHDLRAPLRAITGFCQALKEDYSAGLDAVAQDYLERIVSGSRRMDDLIRDLLDYARVNRAEINRSQVDLDEVFDIVMESMSAELRERKALVKRTAPLGRVMAHEPMLVQVITNLLSNGVKFVPQGKKPEVAVWSESRDGLVRLYVRDNGIGIAPEHHDRIFGIFERLNRAEDYPGTGIGLAIVRRAVERLGGTVGLDSKPEHGSTFWIELPVS